MISQRFKVIGIEQMDRGEIIKVKLEARRPVIPGLIPYNWSAWIYLPVAEAGGIAFGDEFMLYNSVAESLPVAEATFADGSPVPEAPEVETVPLGEGYSDRSNGENE